MATQDDKALVLCLVRDHLREHEYLSWVPAYHKVRWDRLAKRYRACVVGGHWRRQPHVKRTVNVLNCVCKQPEIL